MCVWLNKRIYSTMKISLTFLMLGSAGRIWSGTELRLPAHLQNVTKTGKTDSPRYLLKRSPNNTARCQTQTKGCSPAAYSQPLRFSDRTCPWTSELFLGVAKWYVCWIKPAHTVTLGIVDNRTYTASRESNSPNNAFFLSVPCLKLDIYWISKMHSWSCITPWRTNMFPCRPTTEAKSECVLLNKRNIRPRLRVFRVSPLSGLARDRRRLSRRPQILPWRADSCWYQLMESKSITYINFGQLT